jgi:transposase
MTDLFWLSDAQWAVIEPFMPVNQPGPARKDDRRISSGILHVLTRLPLARLPVRVGPAHCMVPG